MLNSSICLTWAWLHEGTLCTRTIIQLKNKRLGEKQLPVPVKSAKFRRRMVAFGQISVAFIKFIEYKMSRRSLLKCNNVNISNFIWVISGRCNIFSKKQKEQEQMQQSKHRPLHLSQNPEERRDLWAKMGSKLKNWK